MKEETAKVMGELKMLKLAHITPSPTNPRKTFDEDTIDELAKSILEKGVISPIMVRPLGKDTYELVCGERRYRASLSVHAEHKDRNTIPAYIRDMSDDEALELQITENLQRKDVHPMEEAAAFKTLVERNHPAEEISNRLGKSVYFVNQRLKLNSLTDAWQKAFYYDKVSVTDALKIAILNAECQDDLYSNMYSSSDIKDADPVTITKQQLKKYSGDLTDAGFDIADAELDKKVGSCVGCQYNSATANLFADGQGTPTCSNLKCFLNKCELGFEIALQQVINEPDGLLIVESWGNTERISKQFEQYAMPVYSLSHYDTLSEPDKILSFEKWMDEEGYEATDDESLEDLKKDYDTYVEYANDEWEQYRKDKESGEYKRALIVDGNNKGKYEYVQLHGRSSLNVNRASAATDNKGDEVVSIASLTAEIDRIKDREVRSKELDAEKVHTKVKEALKTNIFWKTIGPLRDNELIAGILMYKNAVSYSDRDWAKKLLGAHYDEYGGTKLIEHLQKQSSEQLHSIFNHLLRYKVFVELTSDKDNPVKNSKAAAIRAIAIDYIPAEVKTFDLEQTEVAMKRQERVDKKLSDLKSKKKEMEAAIKPKDEAKPDGKKGKGVKALLPDADTKKAIPKKKTK